MYVTNVYRRQNLVETNTWAVHHKTEIKSKGDRFEFEIAGTENIYW